ncbi:ATP-grasp domain-containing protein [Streptomyces fulvoviolaceus]|uniref:ATP-grasp domain-containing protein n=1 Tax=Streptomyces fulvoviolaceus TaxID=285535 RepID=UPI0021BEB785|nr:ATP-grasp domain-containing protein [Streptomyces fulvoviolaceus]MCT9077928.1 ATP-grasp domain-containing protein [Streptomyces fulvoviolaceus]
MRVLMIGLNSGYRRLVDDNSDLELYVIEEKEIIEANGAAFAAPWIKEVRAGGYQQCDEATQTARKWHRDVGFDAVVPGMEYAVPTAFGLAREWGLGEPGAVATDVCTNKLLLRQLAHTADIPQPRFAEATCADDAKSFFKGRPIVLKPSNRRASVGVIRVDRTEDIESAWQETTLAGEGSRTVGRDLSWRFQCEEYIDGPEISVESVVFEREVLFDNITAKQTVGGRYFTEVGHVAPARVDDQERRPILAQVHRLLTAMDAVSGVFHSEWRVNRGVPHLVECAARPPGDLIPELIRRSQGVDLYDAFVGVLAGRRPNLRPVPASVASVQFFRPPAGRFVRLRGEDALAASPWVFDHEVNLRVGQETPSFANSWQRAGYYALECPDHAALERETRALEQHLEFIVE